MKTNLLVALLALSLVANAALYLQFSSTGPRTLSDARAADTGKTGSISAASPTAGATTAAQAKAEVAQLAKAWASLQTNDLKALAERLRAAGFSPSMIRAIIAGKSVV